MFLNKITELLKFLLGFTGEADHHGGPQVNAGDGRSDIAHQLIRGPGRDTATHPLEDAVRGMLQRHVQVKT